MQVKQHPSGITMHFRRASQGILVKLHQLKNCVKNRNFFLTFSIKCNASANFQGWMNPLKSDFKYGSRGALSQYAQLGKAKLSDLVTAELWDL